MFWGFFGFTWTGHQFNKMTTALELSQQTKTAIAKHRNLAHGPKAHLAPKLPAQQEYMGMVRSILAQTSGTLAIFMLCSELKEVCNQFMQTPFTMGDGPPDGKLKPPPHRHSLTPCARGEGEEASQFSWPQPEALRGGRGSLRPWPPLDPTHRRR